MHLNIHVPDFSVSRLYSLSNGGASSWRRNRWGGTGSLDVGSLCYMPAAMEWSNSIQVIKVNQSHYRPEVLTGFQEVKVPRLRDNGPGWC